MNSRVALVTGGTGGIGTAICKRLVDMGHRVATNYRDEEKARAWQERMRQEGYEVTLVPGDVGTPEGGAALVRWVEAARERAAPGRCGCARTATRSPWCRATSAPPRGAPRWCAGSRRRWARSRSWSTTPASPATPPSTA